MDMLRVTAGKKGIALQCEVEASAAGKVLSGDPKKVRHILQNLVGNAVKFTDSGSVQVSAHVSAENELHITIEDTGPGIPEDQLETIFEPFSRAINQMHQEGSGLGLTIVRGFAEAMGGRIHAENTDTGVRFVLILPAELR